MNIATSPAANLTGVSEEEWKPSAATFAALYRLIAHY